MAALCLTIIQFLRCVQRRPEAGMLKAMGQSNFDLACVAAWEGTFLWLFGTSGGLLAGWMVGTQRARLVYAGEEGSMGFAFTWVDAGFAALAIWIVATLSVQLAASWLWYWRQPAGLLDAT